MHDAFPDECYKQAKLTAYAETEFVNPATETRSTHVHDNSATLHYETKCIRFYMHSQMHDIGNPNMQRLCSCGAVFTVNGAAGRNTKSSQILKVSCFILYPAAHIFI